MKKGQGMSMSTIMILLAIIALFAVISIAIYSLFKSGGLA